MRNNALLGLLAVSATLGVGCGSSGSSTNLNKGGSAGSAGANSGTGGTAGTGPIGGSAGSGAVTGGGSGGSAGIGGAGAGTGGTSGGAGGSGGCTSDANCSSGQICGVTAANACGGCADDSQCQTDPTYGPSFICNTSTSLCVSSTCTTADQACVNPADFCCPSGSGNACVPGNCCSNADCATSSSGTICGAGGPNLCGKCSMDSQCPNGDVCDTASGQCVSDTASQCSGTLPGNAGGKPAACSANSADMCCTSAAACIPSPGANACCPGSAGNTYCQTQLGDATAVCSGNVCTTCAPVSGTNPTYVVDPVNGSDLSGTGSAKLSNGTASENCALKTITRALQLIGSNTTVATTIVIVGGTGVSVGPGETFPIPVPTNVTITTQTGPVAVHVPRGSNGFRLAFPNSSITSGTGAMLTITTTVTPNTAPTAPTGGLSGIRVVAGATATTTISNLTVQGMLSDGILVSGGVVTIGAGVVSTGNGIQPSVRAGFTADGLHVTGSAEAIIDVPSGNPAHFDANTAHGILVDAAGFIHLTGAVSDATTGTGTVTTNGNNIAGVWIQQTPGTTVPQNLITGLASFANTGGNGMRVVAGSNVQVRSSAFLGNQGNGVVISTNQLAANNDISNIDLGNGTTNGTNTFQAALGLGNNARAGICLDVAPRSGRLLAVGNMFHSLDCTKPAGGTLTLNGASCANTAAACAGGVCDLGFVSAARAVGNSFNVSHCTQ